MKNKTLKYLNSERVNILFTISIEKYLGWRIINRTLINDFDEPLDIWFW